MATYQTQQILMVMKTNKTNPMGRMGVLEHLTELRIRIIRSLTAVFIGAIAGWVLYPEIINFILDPYCETLGTDCTLRVDELALGYDVLLDLEPPHGTPTLTCLW